MWTFGHVLNGTEIHRMPKGIFCMAKNLTEVIRSLEKDQRKEFYHPTLHKGKIGIIINTIIFNSVVTYFFLAALKSRSSYIFRHRLFYFSSNQQSFSFIKGRNMI